MSILDLCKIKRDEAHKYGELKMMIYDLVG